MCERSGEEETAAGRERNEEEDRKSDKEREREKGRFCLKEGDRGRDIEIHTESALAKESKRMMIAIAQVQPHKRRATMSKNQDATNDVCIITTQPLFMQ